jgi:hypothetical protein
MRILLILVVCQLFWCCGKPVGDDLFNPARSLGKISEKLDEASGLVASLNNPGMLWSLNDSGNDPSVFLINDRAKIVLTCTLDKVKNRDWEDIAIGPGPEPGKNYLYVADIGDNDAKYKLKFIYRFKEPLLSGDKKMKITEFDTLILRLPDRQRDTETLLIDPITNDLFIVSKREDSVRLYRAQYPFRKDTIILDNLGKLPFKLIVAGSISANGREVLLKNYGKIYYWRRSANESILDLLKRDPIQLAYEPEHQGEAIAWSGDSLGFYTLSESSVVDRAQLRFYKRKGT